MSKEHTAHSGSWKIHIFKLLILFFIVIQILSKNLDNSGRREKEVGRLSVPLSCSLFLPFFWGFVFWSVNLSTLEKVKKNTSGLGYIKSKSWMKHYLYGSVTARTGTGTLAVAKKTSSALSLSFSFRLLFSFSKKQAPLLRELANAGHTVAQCVPDAYPENLQPSKTARAGYAPPAVNQWSRR